MKNIKIGACDWGLPGSGLYATQIAASSRSGRTVSQNRLV